MVAAATPRPRSIAPAPIAHKPRRNMGTLVLIAIPAVLALTMVWQVASSMFHTEVAVRQAVAVGQVTLEGDPAGSRVDFVVVDRVGKETTFTGDVTVRLREPDGTVWQTTRTLSAGDFLTLPDTSLLSGRLGYSVLVPASDWARAPRRGGLATVSVTVNPSDDSPSFSTDSQQLFP
jgi:hypothetical protein